MGNPQGLNHILKCHDLIKSDFISGENCTLTDKEGNTYLDFESGTWCTALGYNHPRIKQAMQKQINQLIHLNHRYSQEIVNKTAKKILSLLKMDQGKCLFLTSGSEAVTCGLEMAKKVTGKSRFITLRHTYLAAYGEARERTPGIWQEFDWSECLNCQEESPCNSDCSHFKSINFKDLAGFVFEPGNSSGLVLFPPEKLVKALEAEIRDNNSLLIVDEVTTGIGRTGKWFGFQHYQLNPGIVAMGKGLGNGYPISCVGVTQDVAKQLEQAGFIFAQSHSNEPLGGAVAEEVLNILQETNLIEKSCETARYFFDQLMLLQTRYPVICDIRGRGLMMAIEFQTGELGLEAEKIVKRLFEKGFLVETHPADNILRFYPALTISNAQIDRLITELSNIFDES